jgi:hypothetical protein
MPEWDAGGHELRILWPAPPLIGLAWPRETASSGTDAALSFFRAHNGTTMVEDLARLGSRAC